MAERATDGSLLLKAEDGVTDMVAPPGVHAGAQGSSKIGDVVKVRVLDIQYGDSNAATGAADAAPGPGATIAHLVVSTLTSLVKAGRTKRRKAAVASAPTAGVECEVKVMHAYPQWGYAVVAMDVSGDADADAEGGLFGYLQLSDYACPTAAATAAAAAAVGNTTDEEDAKFLPYGTRLKAVVSVAPAVGKVDAKPSATEAGGWPQQHAFMLTKATDVAASLSKGKSKSEANDANGATDGRKRSRSGSVSGTAVAVSDLACGVHVSGRVLAVAPDQLTVRIKLRKEGDADADANGLGESPKAKGKKGKKEKASKPKIRARVHIADLKHLPASVVTALTGLFEDEGAEGAKGGRERSNSINSVNSTATSDGEEEEDEDDGPVLPHQHPFHHPSLALGGDIGFTVHRVTTTSKGNKTTITVDLLPVLGGEDGDMDVEAATTDPAWANGADEASALAVGQSHKVVVMAVQREGCLVALSPTVKGFVDALDMTTDLSELASWSKLAARKPSTAKAGTDAADDEEEDDEAAMEQENEEEEEDEEEAWVETMAGGKPIRVGMSLDATVVSFDSDKKRCALSLLAPAAEAPKPTKGKKGKKRPAPSAASTPALPRVGETRVCRVLSPASAATAVVGATSKGLAGASCMALVQLSGRVQARVCITEVADMEAWSTLEVDGSGFVIPAPRRSNAGASTNAGDSEVRTGSDATGPLEQGEYRLCRVVAVDEARGHIECSLRPSRVAAAAGGASKKRKLTNPAGNTLLADADPAEETFDTADYPPIGAVVKGFVIGTNAGGCFVRVGRGLVGRVMIKNLSDQFVANPKIEFPEGRLVAAKVTSVDEDAEKLELNLRPSAVLGGDADTLAKQELAALEIGSKIRGTVTRVEPFGVFIRLDGLKSVTGMCHRSEAADRFVEDLTKFFSAGDLVKAVVLKVELDTKRLSLGLKASYFDQDDASEDESEEDESEEEESAMEVEEVLCPDYGGVSEGRHGRVDVEQKSPSVGK